MYKRQLHYDLRLRNYDLREEVLWMCLVLFLLEQECEKQESPMSLCSKQKAWVLWLRRVPMRVGGKPDLTH